MPLPAFVNTKVPEVASLMMPLMVLAAVLVTLKVPFNLIAAAVSAAVLIVVLPKGVVLPTAPVMLVLPVPFVLIVSVLPAALPSIVEPNEIVPFDVVVSVLLVVNVTAPV